MVIRRVREHVATHNWFAVAIDLAIVVAGVFLGIQVSNWNEARIQDAQAREYRDRLISEIDFNRLQYGQQLAYYQRVRAHGLSLLDKLRDPGRPRGADFLVDAYQATQLDVWPAKRFIYDEMASAGMAARIGSPRVQELASDFYLGIEATQLDLSSPPPYRSAVRKAMPHAIQEKIRDQCGDRLVAVKGRIVGIALPARCAVDISPQLVAEGVSRISGQEALEAELNGHLAALGQKIDILDQMIEQAELVLAALRAG
jgi:hypothetical protein